MDKCTRMRTDSGQTADGQRTDADGQRSDGARTLYICHNDNLSICYWSAYGMRTDSARMQTDSGRMQTDSGRMRMDSARMRTDSGRTLYLWRTDDSK